MQLELEFPLAWEFRVVAEDTPATQSAIGTVLDRYGYAQRPVRGRSSRHGKYVTYSVRVVIPSRDHLEVLAQSLSSCPGVRFLL
jgi:putative lipoic acid-binding regulatory protein